MLSLGGTASKVTFSLFNRLIFSLLFPLQPLPKAIESSMDCSYSTEKPPRNISSCISLRLQADCYDILLITWKSCLIVRICGRIEKIRAYLHGSPWELEKVVVTRAGRLRECSLVRDHKLKQ